MGDRSVHVRSEVRQSVVVTGDGNTVALPFGDSGIRPSLQGAAGSASPLTSSLPGYFPVTRDNSSVQQDNFPVPNPGIRIQVSDYKGSFVGKIE
jgi:hypothetical protein